MKYLIVLICLYLNLYSEDYYFSTNLKAKSITIYNLLVSYKNKKTVTGNSISIYLIRYNDTGIISEEVSGRNEKEISWRKKYVYETDEKKIKKRCKDILNMSDANEEILKICSDNLKKIHEIKLEIIEEEVLATTFLIKERNVNTYYIFDSSYSLDERMIKIFDDKENIKEEHKYDKNNNLIYKKIYDRDKLLLTLKTYDKDNSLKSILKREYRVDGTLRKETFMEYTFAQNLSSKREIFYNAYGLKEEEKWYDSNGTFYRNFIFEYELDFKGNWIKEIKYLRDITSSEKRPESAVKRAIEY